MKKDIEGFLKELTNLSLSYGIIVGGCGCCGSPYLESADNDLDIDGISYDDLTWEEDHYEMKNIYPTESISGVEKE